MWTSTGERVWHYQFVRHDLWDRDLPSPPNLITLERDAETGADAVHDVSLTGAPISVVYNRTQAKTFLYIYIRHLVGTPLANLRLLMAAGLMVNVKLAPGSATVVPCMFGPRAEQKLEPWNGPHTDGRDDGSVIDPILLQYKAELMLLRHG